MRAEKRAEIDAFRVRYARLRDTQWNGNGAYDAWVAAPINNARLLPFGLYDEYQSAFARVFAEAGGCWPAFFERVRELAKRSVHDREAAMRRLQADSNANAGQLPRERCGGAP
jgi:predicted aminopeptidase